VSLRNLRLLDLSVMKVRPVTVVQTCAAADVCCASLFYTLKVQGCEQRCVRFPYRRWYQIRSCWQCLGWCETCERSYYLLSSIIVVQCFQRLSGDLLSSCYHVGVTNMWGRYRCANTSPTLIFRLWIYTLDTLCPIIRHWTQWSPHSTGCSSCCVTGVATAVVLASAGASDVARVMTLCLPPSGAPNGFFRLPASARVVGAAWPRTKTARSLEAKPPCGRFPHIYLLSFLLKTFIS
jgi:hypothetical protein